MGLTSIAALGLAIVLKTTLSLVYQEGLVSLITKRVRVRKDPTTTPLLPMYEPVQYQACGHYFEERSDIVSVTSLPSLVSGNNSSETDTEVSSVLSYPSLIGDPGIVINCYDT